MGRGGKQGRSSSWQVLRWAPGSLGDLQMSLAASRRVRGGEEGTAAEENRGKVMAHSACHVEKLAPPGQWGAPEGDDARLFLASTPFRQRERERNMESNISMRIWVARQQCMEVSLATSSHPLGITIFSTLYPEQYGLLLSSPLPFLHFLEKLNIFPFA